MDEHPPLDQVRAHFDEWNTAYRSSRFEDIDAEIRVRGEIVLEAIERLGAPCDGILEIGCGTGWLSERLQAFGPVTAIDLAPRAIEIAAGRGLDVRFIAGDFLAEPFEPESFDVVVCVETLFYIQDQVATVQKISELLRPGGVAIFTCINKFVYERRKEIGPPRPGQPRHWLSLAELRRLLAKHLRVEWMRTVEPRGELGVLRIVNSPKIEAVLRRIASEDVVKRAKERAGLGGGVVVQARKAS